MHIKEIVIEGFKSYAVRTVISEWDPQFNAITGLNGSGKSNILDAICFVLGITSLSNVRAANLNDLVYKRGQAGIQKASVSIVFDNSNREASPVGYAEFPQIVVTRQVMIGGKNKYIVNGHTTPQHAVHNLFQSVQLNVNNPHFLIMQGRITKVLNMKASEILSMIEEATGTRMYEERKERALATIAKKGAKLDEINSLLNDELIPKLNKLRSERAAYREFQITKKEMERLEKLVVQLEHYKFRYLARNATKEVDFHESSVQSTRDDISTSKHKLEEIERMQSELMDKVASEAVKLLEEKNNEISKDISKLTAKHSLSLKSVEEQRNRTILLERSIDTNDPETIKTLFSALTDIEHSKDRINSRIEEEKRELDRLEALLVSLTLDSGGVDAKREIEESLEEERAILKQIEQEKVSLDSLISNAQKDLDRILADLEKTKSFSDTIIKELNLVKESIRNIEAAKCDLKRSIELHQPATIKSQLDCLLKEISEKKEEAETIGYQVGHYVNFEYNDPIPNFDRSKVKGPIAGLVLINEKNYQKSTALEIVAGARLLNVVVDNEEVASQILKRGGLQRRVTLIPLNKIQTFALSRSKIDTASQISKGAAEIAISLIDYSPNVKPAIEYVFASTFISKDAQTANSVTFHPSIRARSVTWAGDVYDPSGVLSGGSKPSSSGILSKISKLQLLKQEIAQLVNQQDELTKKYQEIDQSHKLRQMDTEYELARSKEKHLEQKLAVGGISGLEERKKAAEKVLIELKRRLENVIDKETRTKHRLESLQREFHEFASDKVGKTAEIKKNIGQQKKTIADLKKNLINLEQQKAMTESEHEQAIQSLNDRQQELEIARQHLQLEERELEAATKMLDELQRTISRIKMEMQAEKKKQKGIDGEIRQINIQKAQIKTEIEDLEIKLKSQTKKLCNLKTDAKNAVSRLEEIEKSYEWVVKSQDAYEDTNPDIKMLSSYQKQYQELEKRHSILKNNINVRVMEMIELAEQREAELKGKIQTVLRDKSKIEETIRKLDAVKAVELSRTWEKVNVDFGAIFNDLLPGNLAKLEPVNGNILQGLDIKVRLGSIWKESLSELSGGQRSLVALSLILALLQFKPAPMYILDEVDAALDLSHTQNIGQLIKTRFTNSQFIIVSLKENMFNNAHVIYRTKFREGTSTVERIRTR